MYKLCTVSTAECVCRPHLQLDAHKMAQALFCIFKLYLIQPYFLWLLHLHCLSSSVLANCMQYGPLEASSLPSGGEIRLVLWNPKAPYRARFVSHDVASEGSDFLDLDAAARGVSKERSAFTCKGSRGHRTKFTSGRHLF